LNTNHQQLVEVRGLVKHFPVENSDDVARAVDGVSFEIFVAKRWGWSANPVVASLPSDVVCCV
jgi:hypothetical protein